MRTKWIKRATYDHPINVQTESRLDIHLSKFNGFLFCLRFHVSAKEDFFIQFVYVWLFVLRKKHFSLKWINCSTMEAKLTVFGCATIPGGNLNRKTNIKEPKAKEQNWRSLKKEHVDRYERSTGKLHGQLQMQSCEECSREIDRLVSLTEAKLAGEASAFTFQLFLHSCWPLSPFPLSPLHGHSLPLTAGDKHRPNPPEHRRQVSEGEFWSPQSSLANVSCLCTGEVAGAHVSPAFVTSPQRYAACCCRPCIPNSEQHAVCRWTGLHLFSRTLWKTTDTGE